MQHILAINIKNSATCFGSLTHHQAKYQHTVLVHSVSVHTINVPVLCSVIWPDDGSVNQNMSPNF